MTEPASGPQEPIGPAVKFEEPSAPAESMLADQCGLAGEPGEPEPGGPPDPKARPPGPTVAFTFNLGKIPAEGEDSDPILRDGRDLGLVAVFDGMGGAGGTVYETPDGRRTGAYIASRLARDVVERRMLVLLDPAWNLDGPAAAKELQAAVKEALVERLAELKAPPSGLRSKLLRALPTTMALVALQRAETVGPTWTGHVMWAGDSRAYVFYPAGGAQQLTTDDIRDEGDAMANLREDSVVSNAMSADADFLVHHRKIELEEPFLVVGATDGCFGYEQSPMHFERLLIAELVAANDVTAWSESLQAHITAITGDDAAMGLLGVGAKFESFQALFERRALELEERFIKPFDALQDEVDRAESALEELRRKRAQRTAELWSSYKPGYERHLRPITGEGTGS